MLEGLLEVFQIKTFSFAKKGRDLYVWGGTKCNSSPSVPTVGFNNRQVDRFGLIENNIRMSRST